MKKLQKLIVMLCVAAMVLVGCSSKATSSDNGQGDVIKDSKNGTKEFTNNGEPSKNQEGITPEAKKEPVEFTLWHETEEGIASILAEELAKLEPEIKVNVVRKDNITEALKLSVGDSSSAPDFIWFAHDKIGLFAEMGIIEPIDDYVNSDDYEKFLPLTKEAGLYQGKHYQVPAYYETLMFMYNKAQLDKAPATTEDLLTMMKEKTTGGKYGFVEQHSTAYYASAWIHAFGGSIINDKAEPGLNSAEMIDALTYHKQFADLMPTDGEWTTVTTLFLEGNAASIVNGPWFVAGVKDAGIDLGVAPLPTVNVNGQALKPYSGVQGIMLSATCRDKEAAKTVLQFLCKKDLSEAIAIKNGAAPAHNDAYENEAVKNSEVIMTLKECAKNAVPMPNIPQMDVMWTCTENALAAINKSGADIKATLDSAQKEAIQGIEAMQ